jgi:hypothetical protein
VTQGGIPKLALEILCTVNTWFVNWPVPNACSTWELSTEEMARLDEATAVPEPYTYWHQQTWAGARNPHVPARRAWGWATPGSDEIPFLLSIGEVVRRERRQVSSEYPGA